MSRGFGKKLSAFRLCLGWVLACVLTSCNSAPVTPEGTVRVTLRSLGDGTDPIELCAPETSITQLSRMLDGGRSTSLFELALVWSEGPGSTLRIATTAEHPPRRLSSGRAHPDDRLSITLTILDTPEPPGRVPHADNLVQNDENRVADLPGAQFDLYRERWWPGDLEELRPPSGVWQGSRLSIHCKNDPQIVEWFEGHRLCEFFFSDSDLSYNVTTGRTWLQHWPHVITAVEEAIARYREQCG